MGRFYNPVECFFGIGALELASERVGAAVERCSSVLLLTRGGNFALTDTHSRLARIIGRRPFSTFVADCSNPDLTDLFELLRGTASLGYDLVVAAGGGSVLDLGKTLAAFRGMSFADIGELRETVRSGAYAANRGACPWIAVPTTAGTGSEMTPWATIWDRAESLKYSVESGEMFALAAVVDPAATIGLPLKTSLSSALDALCHAAEAYWARGTNEVSRVFSLRSIGVIVENFGRLAEYPDELSVRERIALGSSLAGLAFSNTKTTACHAISYPLTLSYGIDHGIAASLTLGAMMRWNAEHILEAENLYRAFGAADADGAVERIALLFKQAGFSMRLRDYGIREGDISSLVDRAYTKGRMDNNPRAIEKAELYRLLLDLY